ncbi:methyltransferase [Noviherbaspirillum aerium]|uniref:methyltransferase n=1 Tax=Noviherbaspirillum aerium TaxID=2588497 RepID=UPI00124BE965|nr:methyltransferase [Noviherbaspirillum aerium]
MSSQPAAIIRTAGAEFPETWVMPGHKTWASHARHVAHLAQPQPGVSLNGTELCVPANVYHPGIGLSSRFLVDALCALKPGIEGAVLDLGCGSGFVGLSLHQPGMKLVLADISPAAVASTSENLRRLGLAAEVMQSDLFRELRGRRFDAIIFNPPLLDKRVEHTAEVALCDPDGRLLSRFLDEAHHHLAAQGKLFFTASNLMNRGALLGGLSKYRYHIIASAHDGQSEVSRWVICATPA